MPCWFKLIRSVILINKIMHELLWNFQGRILQFLVSELSTYVNVLFPQHLFHNIAVTSVVFVIVFYTNDYPFSQCSMFACVSAGNSTVNLTLSWLHLSPSIRIRYQLPLLILHSLYVNIVNESACCVSMRGIRSWLRRLWRHVLVLDTAALRPLAHACLSMLVGPLTARASQASKIRTRVTPPLRTEWRAWMQFMQSIIFHLLKVGCSRVSSIYRLHTTGSNLNAPVP